MKRMCKTIRQLSHVGLVLALAVAPSLFNQVMLRLHAFTQSVSVARAAIGNPSDLASPHNAVNAVITITLQRLEPAGVTIAAGDSVTWRNLSTLTQTLRIGLDFRVHMPIVLGGKGSDVGQIRIGARDAVRTSRLAPIVQALGAGEWFTYTFVAVGHVVFSVANHTGNVIVLPSEPTFAIVAAGDIARCSGLSGAHDTANLIKGMPEAQVLALGDLAYSSGTDAEFQNCYGPTWGQFKDRTHPSPGNHEYRTAGAAGYYRYFGVPEYYAWDFGGWHFVSFNTEIDYAASSAQMNWLRADLAASPARCKLVYWHRPRFSSGASHGNTSALSSVWAVLQSYSVTLVLAGHEHNYERFGPQDASGRAMTNGIREFVVGTGGTGFYRFNATPEPNSEFRLTNAYGVLKLDLLPSSYSWQFITVDGVTGIVKDSGTASCN